jgi:hypothetical protein
MSHNTTALSFFIFSFFFYVHIQCHSSDMNTNTFHSLKKKLFEFTEVKNISNFIQIRWIKFAYISQFSYQQIGTKLSQLTNICY